MRMLLDASLEYGLRNPPVRWVMLAAPFASGVGFYTFYALQPYLLGLWGLPLAIIDAVAHHHDDPATSTPTPVAAALRAAHAACAAERR